MSTFDVVYCWDWNVRLAQPIESTSESVARKQDSIGEQYTAVLFDGQGVAERTVTVVWKNNHVGLDFLDYRGRPVCRYFFTRMNPQYLFVSELEIREWDEQGQMLNESTRIETSIYKPDGTLVWEEIDPNTGVGATQEGRQEFLEYHWEPVPEFGNWASVARYDRSLPMDQQPSGRPWV